MRYTLAASAILTTLGGLLLAIGCSSDDGDTKDDDSGALAEWCEPEPAGSDFNSEVACDQRCPGGPDCAPGGDPTLYAGASVKDISPVVDHVVAFAPDNVGNNHFNPLAGDKCVEKASCDLSNPQSCPAVDPQKCTWIAGFGVGRPATGVADPSTVRCAVIRQASTKIGLCSIDAVGWFYNEVERTRELIASDFPDLADVDFVMIASTHVHETQDTMGLWGPVDGESGTKPEFNAMIRQKTAEALSEANANLRAVHVEFGASQVDGHIDGTDPAGNKTQAFVSDTRDPVVMDIELRTLRFVATDDQSTVATLVNFTSHPEFADDRNFLTSSDYVHTLREGIENGLTSDETAGAFELAGVGGVAIFFNGALGGQVGPGDVIHTDFAGDPVPEGLERAYNNGRLLAVYAHEAMTDGVEKRETVPIGFRAREIYVDVFNDGYHIAIAQGLFDRDGYFYDPTLALSAENFPAIRSQIAILDIGPAELLTIPGELHTELLLATRDGKTGLDDPYPFTPAPYNVLENEGNVAPPDITAMQRDVPIDLARDPKATYRWVIGLGLDQYGYIVPEYDYKLDSQNPYLEEAPGDHYEETNSVGTNAQAHTVGPIKQLLKTPPVITRAD